MTIMQKIAIVLLLVAMQVVLVSGLSLYFMNEILTMFDIWGNYNQHEAEMSKILSAPKDWTLTTSPYYGPLNLEYR